MEFETVITVASAVAALLSALYASRAARSAAKSLDLALNDHSERHENIHAQLIDGLAWETLDKANMVAFACTLINRAVAPNTIVRTELHVYEFDNSGQATKLVLTPVPADVPSIWSFQAFPLPLNLAPRSTVSGWVTFRIPDHFAKEKQIDKYEVVFLNSVGGRASVEQYLIRKVQNATTTS